MAKRRGMSKKAKAEAYDALASEHGLMMLLLHDIGVDRAPDANVTASALDPLGSGDTVYCRARAWRLTGASGGIALLTIWTVDADGHKSIDATRSVYVDKMQGTCARTAYERVIGTCGARLRGIRSDAYAAQGT